MATWLWPRALRLLVIGVSVTFAPLAPCRAQDTNPANRRPGAASTGNSGPLLGAAAESELEAVDEAPDLMPIEAPRRQSKTSGKPSAAGQGPAANSDAPRSGARYQQPQRAARSSGRVPRRPQQEPQERASFVDGAMRDPNARRVSAESNAPAGSGAALLAEAYSRSVTATDERGYSETIEFCRAGMQAGVKGASATYARQLMAWAYNKRGESRSAAGRDAEALDDFEASVSLDNTSWRALHNRGVSYAAMGKLAEAVEDFSRTIEINREFGLAYYNRGEMRYEQGDYASAIEDYNAAARWMPNDPSVLNSRGHAQYRLRRLKEAVADFNLALEIDPQNAAALVNRGDVYADMSFYAEAADDYKHAIGVDPEMGRAYQSAAWLMATCPQKQYRNGRLAVEAAKRAISLDGAGDYRYLATLAAAHAAQGQFPEAVQIQRSALSAAPETARASQAKRLALYEARKPFLTALHDAQGRSGGQIRDAPQRSATAVSGEAPQRR